MRTQSAMSSRPVAVTMGEPAGIGGEVTLKAWRILRETGPRFCVLDSPERLASLARRLNASTPFRVIADPCEVEAAFCFGLPIIPIGLSAAVEPGWPNPRNAGAVIAAIERAVAMAVTGEVAAVVTNPIQKSALYEVGFCYPGHTEFLGALAGKRAPPVMMLACPELRVVPVTVHVSLIDAIAMLTSDLIVEQARIAWSALRSDFGVAQPRLAIAGLNPHAGESGAMGDEDERIIRPAVEALKRGGIDAVGPMPPDTMFTARARRRYDVAICMYHDQALIPLKAIDVDGGVNVTLGLKIVRTSPDHGTALDIAGQGVADPGSLVAAIQMAADIASRRAAAG